MCNKKVWVVLFLSLTCGFYHICWWISSFSRKTMLALKQDVLKVVFEFLIYLWCSVVNLLSHVGFSWNKNHNIFLVLAFPKCGLPFFLCCKYNRRYQEFCIFQFYFKKSKIVQIWTKIFIPRVILKAQRKSNYILEMPRQGRFCLF